MFYITISNGLLKNDHRKRMGSAVWEFMWCIDKVTRIDEDGTGWVLGGKPIRLSDLAGDMGVSEDTISRNLITLEEEGYIVKTIAPYGIVIKVKQAKKRFGKNVEPRRRNVEPRRENVEPNKTKAIDKAVDGVLLGKTRVSNSEDDEIQTIATDGEGNELRTAKKSGGRNAGADRVANYYAKKAREYTGNKQVLGYGYAIVKKLMEEKKLTEKFLTGVVDEFFESMPPDDKAVNPYICFSNKNINRNLLS